MKRIAYLISLLAAAGTASAAQTPVEVSIAPPQVRAPHCGMVVAVVPGPVKDVQPGLQESEAGSVATYLRLHCQAMDALGGVHFPGACRLSVSR